MLQENFSENNTSPGTTLVTGAAGLVGNELVTQLASAGVKVRALYHAAPVSFSHPGIEAVQCDILDVTTLQEAMEGVTNVYHSAALVSYDPRDKYRLFKTNIEGTANVVNACIEAGVRKLLHVSSVAALGRIRAEETVTEKMNWTEETSNSIYGKSKYFGEMEVWRGIAEGLHAVIVNPTLILGGRNWESGSSTLFKNAYDEFKWYTDGISGFVDVRDVAQVMILLMNSEISSERFILNAENLPYREIFSRMAACFGKKPPYRKASPLLAELIWRVEDIKSRLTRKKCLLTKETARTAQARVYFDNSKILEAFPGFEFTPIKETIDFTCGGLKERYHL